MFPYFSNSERVIKTPQKSERRSKKKRQKTNLQESSFDMTWTGAKYFALQIFRYIFIPFQRRMAMSKVCVSHVFPSLQMTWLFFVLLWVFNTLFPSFELLWKSFGAMLLYLCLVDSILFVPFFSFRQTISCKTFLQHKKRNTTTHTGRKSMQIVPTAKKRNSVMWCFFFLLLIMEQNAEIPFAKAISL